MQSFGITPFSSYKITVKQQLNGEKMRCRIPICFFLFFDVQCLEDSSVYGKGTPPPPPKKKKKNQYKWGLGPWKESDSLIKMFNT